MVCFLSKILLYETHYTVYSNVSKSVQNYYSLFMYLFDLNQSYRTWGRFFHRFGKFLAVTRSVNMLLPWW